MTNTVSIREAANTVTQAGYLQEAGERLVPRYDAARFLVAPALCHHLPQVVVEDVQAFHAPLQHLQPVG